MLTESLEGFWVTLRSRRVTCATHLNCDDTLTLTILLDICVTWTHTCPRTSTLTWSHRMKAEQVYSLSSPGQSIPGCSGILGNTGKTGKESRHLLLSSYQAAQFVLSMEPKMSLLLFEEKTVWKVNEQNLSVFTHTYRVKQHSSWVRWFPPRVDGFIHSASCWALSAGFYTTGSPTHTFSNIHTPLDADTWGLNLAQGFLAAGCRLYLLSYSHPVNTVFKKAVWHALNLSNLIWYQYLQYGQVSLHWQCYFSQS